MHASLAIILTTAAVAFAQTSSAPGASPTDGISPCVLQCLTTAASSGGCSSFTDTSCVCTSTDFQTAVASCLQQNCTPQDLAAALALQQQNCGAAGSGSSGASSAASTSTTVAISVSTTTTGSGTGSATAAGTGSATTAAGTGSTAAGSGSGTGSSTRPVTSGATTSGGSTSSAAGSQSSSPSSGEKVALFGRGGLVAGVVAVGGALVGGLLL